MLLREKARQEFAGQERLVTDLVESQIKLLKMIEDLEALDPSVISSSSLLSTPSVPSVPNIAAIGHSASVILEDSMSMF
jgi:hypothetical protein